MNEQNPYQAPSAEIPEAAEFPRRWRVAVLVLVASQTLLSLLSLPAALDLVQHGEISPLVLLVAAVATLLLAFGGVLLMLSRPRIAGCLFGASAMLGSPVLLQWPVKVAITGLVVAFVAGALSVCASRFLAER